MATPVSNNLSGAVKQQKSGIDAHSDINAQEKQPSNALSAAKQEGPKHDISGDQVKLSTAGQQLNSISDQQQDHSRLMTPEAAKELAANIAGFITENPALAIQAHGSSPASQLIELLKG